MTRFYRSESKTPESPFIFRLGNRKRARWFRRMIYKWTQRYHWGLVNFCLDFPQRRFNTMEMT